MKAALISTLAFICGLLGGTLLPSGDESAGSSGSDADIRPPLALSPDSDAFADWQRITQSGIGGDGGTLNQMAGIDGPKAWESMIASNPRPRLAEVEALARRWASHHGKEAVEFGLGIADPILRGAFLSVALSRWFGSEPESMLAWLRTRPDRLQLASRTTPIEYLDVLRQDATSLHHIGALFEGGPDPAPYANHALHVWRQVDQQEAVLTWLRRQPESFERDLAWKGIAEEMALTEPHSAAALAKQVSDEGLRRQITSTAAACLARADTRDAFIFASRLPEGKDRTTAWQSVLGTWALNDPAAALEFVRQNAASITTETIRPVIRPWTLSQPAELLRLVQGMQDENGARESIVSNVVSEWRRQSPEEVRRWLVSPDAAWVPESSRMAFQRALDQPMSFGSGSRTVQGRRFWFGG